MAHLLTTRAQIDEFTAKVDQVLKSGGFLCLAARNPDDLEPDGMVRVDEGVYEYVARPGHRIRYWDEATFNTAFGKRFQIIGLIQAVEEESASQPVPCHITIMIGRKKPITGLEANGKRIDGNVVA
jgi:hypothetical protein